ncbi:MAG: tetratricopeptide repeat protein [Leptospirales bacterium]
MGRLQILSLIFAILVLSPFEAPFGVEESTFEKAEKFYFQKKITVAKNLLLEVIKAEPAHPKAYSYLGDIALANGKYEVAINYYKTAVEVSPTPALEYYRLGQVYIKLGKGNLALDNFQRAYTTNPSLKPTLYQIGYVYLVMMRNKQGTIKYWTQFLEEAPNDPQYDKVEEALKYLRDEKCVLPPLDSHITIEEVLKIGCRTVDGGTADTKGSSAGHSDTIIKNDPLLDLPDDEDDL